MTDTLCIADGLRIGPADGSGRQAIGIPRTGRYMRLPAALLTDLVASTPQSRDRLRAKYGALTDRLEGAGLLVDIDTDAPTATRRVLVRRITSVQLTLWNPDATLAGIARATARVGMRAIAIAVAVIGLVGFVVDVATRPVSPISLVASQPPTFALVLLLGLWLSTWLHELAHGYTLKRFGGVVPRMGVMLFYFVPAAFCDVSDAWRLTSRRQRAAVAVAGPASQWAIGGFTALSGVAASHVFVGAPIVGAGLAGFSWVMFVAAAANLAPFCRLDGYWVVTALVDIGNVTDHAKERLNAFMHGRRDAATTAWSAYAVATALFRVMLLFTAIGFYASVSHRRPPGALFAVIITVAVVIFIVVRSRLAGTR